MKPPSIERISSEDLQGEDALPRLLQALNPFMGQVVQALRGELTFSENFRAELKTLDVKVPEAAWVAPSMINSWVNFGAGGETAGYRIDPSGMVHVKGLVMNGVIGTAVFTLPAGYRPPRHVHLATNSNGAFGSLIIHPGGDVYAFAGSNIWFSLACSFLATTPVPPAAFVGTDWPILFSTKLADPRMVLPVQVFDPNGTPKSTFGGPTIDWERAADGRLKIKSVYGLTPGRAYKLTVLVTGG